jgi:hypothetical protein
MCYLKRALIPDNVVCVFESVNQGFALTFTLELSIPLIWRSRHRHSGSG